mgnify:CR=1 FL=1
MIDAERIANGDFNPDNTQNMCFSTISLHKICILSIITFGLYDVIWGYKLWRIIQTEFGYKHINPLLRVLFFGITNFSLFDILNKYFFKYNEKTFPPFLFAILYLLLNVLNNLPKPYFLISFLSTYFIVQIQKKINSVNKINFPNAPVNEWNYANTIWATVFGLLFVSVIIYACS